MPRSHYQSTNVIKDQGSMLSSKSISSIEMSVNENYLGESLDTESKRTITNLKNSSSLMKTQRNGLIILNNEQPCDAQENTNIRSIEMRKAI